MSFCEHCQGQRFDRARVLRVLRQVRRELPHRDARVEASLMRALEAVRALELPHLDVDDDDDPVVH